MTAVETLIRQPFTIALGWTLAHFLWQGAAIALVFALVNRLLSRSSAAVRYAAAYTALLLMPFMTVATFLWLNSSDPAGALAGPAQIFHSAAFPAHASSGAARNIAGAVSFPAPFEDWLNANIGWLAALWSAGVLLLSARIAAGWIFAQRMKRLGTKPAGPKWQAALARLAQRLGVNRPVRLCESTLAKVPTVIGWLRPAILLPASALSGLTPELMEALVAHELAHIRRHDYVLNLVQTAVETILFYHPAVWWIGRRIRIERENCCDDLAVAACGDALTYARALTEMAGLRITEPQFAMAATGGSLLARIRRLIGVSETSRSTPAPWVAGLAVLLTFGALWAAESYSFSYHYSASPAAEAQVSSTAPGTAQASHAALVEKAEADPLPAESAAGDEPDPSPGPQPAQEPAAAPKGSKGDYIAGMAAAGYQNLSVDQLIAMKIHDVTPEYVRQMESLGIHHPNPEKLIAMRIHDVTPAFVSEMKSAGFNLSIDQLVAFKIHDVDPARVKEMQRMFGKVTPDEIVAAQIHEMTPEYAAQMKSLGLGDPAFDQLIAMKIHDVTPDFAKKILATGVKGIDLDHLVAFSIHGVDPAKVAEMEKLGFGTLNADQIVALQIHGVTPELLRGFKDLGFTKLTIDEALAASIHGVTPDFVKAAKSHGFNNLTMEQIIKLKQFDILQDK